MITIAGQAVQEVWRFFVEAAPFMLFGLFAGGLVKVFVGAAAVARHLGRGRFSSVLKAALIGIPLPLCSCGVLPAAAALKKQGANNGATTAFLISTPESGLDSISVTYALMDPLMTVARPLAAFFTAMLAGFWENLGGKADKGDGALITAAPCPVDGCCDGSDCAPADHARHHGFAEKIAAAMRYGFIELWDELAGWFMVGIVLAGVISALVPDEIIGGLLGGGILSMLAMLVAGIPLYICASASTPIAAALLLKGASPGAVLVFLLAGPATNIASITVLKGLLGRRATVVYLAAIVIGSLASGLAVNLAYPALGLSPSALSGPASETTPEWIRLGGAAVLLALSVAPARRILKGFFHKKGSSGCGCNGSCCG